jgi:hypothetical protein
MTDKQRDPRIDPKPGDVVGHIDGGKMIVVKRLPRTVHVKRNSSFYGRWILLSTFKKNCDGREVLHAAE